MARKKEEKSPKIKTNLEAKIVPASIEQEMKSSYIDYAMSVIVGRALPDIRDGLKPVHRRILYAMTELGLQPGKPYKKSARVVGEVLGKYHPHGDSAVYDSMVRMAQNFSLRYMLIDGQGNFGSVDGDSAAAMRYTETRLGKISTEMLEDIEKDTVDFGPNFDESLQEPLVLPSKIPNLLINGSSGIAVGMATNIPSHNLSEVVDAAIQVIEDPEIEISELMKTIKGPDFPTGAIICGRAGIKDAYTTGRGLLKVRGRVEYEEYRGKDVIIVKEIPYMANKAELISEIASLVKEKKVVGISDLRDESDRKGMRIYIEVKKDVNTQVVLNQLYKRTRLQTTYGVNLVALVDGQPRVLNLKLLLTEYLKHREIVVTRRTKFELKKAEDQAHILEGLLIAVANIDKIIKLIRGSKNPDEARSCLMKQFKLSRVQAQAILDMRLQKLTQLERYKIEDDYKALIKKIKELKKILGDREEVLNIIKAELLAAKNKYGDKRRTSIAGEIEDVAIEALIPEEEVAVLITLDGYIKRMPVNTFKAQLRGGRGVTGMTTREEDAIDTLFVASTHDFVLFFTNKGRVYKLKVYDLPKSSRAGKGQSIANVLQVSQGESITANVLVRSFEKKSFLIMATKEGLIKKVMIGDFANIRRSGIIAIKLKGNDELRWVDETNGEQEILLGAQSGLMIRFGEKNVRPMGRAASGVRGIRLKKTDKVVAMEIVTPKGDLLVVSDSVYGKRMKIKEFGLQNRGGKGHIAIKLRANDKVAGMKIINSEDEILFVTKNGTMSRQKASGISTQGRYAKGVRIQKLDSADIVIGLARVVTKEQEEKVLEEAAKKE